MSGSGTSSQLNPNIALQAGQGVTQPINLLASYGQMQQIQKNALAIQSGQQDINSRDAIGDAVQQSIGPDGTIDQGKFRSLVSQNPDAAWGAQTAVGTSQDQQGQNYRNNAAGLAQSEGRNAAFVGFLQSDLANTNPQPEDVYDAISRMHQAGIPTDEAVGQAATMPHQGGAALHQWLQNVAGSTMKAGDFLPQTSFVNTGGSVQGVDTNPITNPNAPSTSVPATLSPGEQVNPVAGPMTPGGGKTVIPAAAYAAQNGLGNLIPSTGRAPLPASLVGPGGQPPAGSPPPQGGTSSFGTGGGNAPPESSDSPFGNSSGVWSSGGSASGGSASPFGGAGGPSGPASSSPAGASGGSSPFGGGGAPAFTPMQTSLGPGQEAGLASAGNESAKQWSDLQSQVGGTAAGGGSAGRIYQLQKSLGLLQQLGPTGTGPSAASQQSIMSYVRSLPGIGTAINGISSPQGVANYDEATKYLTAYAAARAGAHGGTTDSQLATTLSSNASTHISNLAAQDVVKANIGLERMDQAQAQAFQQTGQTPDQFANFSANWNNSMDPRAFVADQLSQGQAGKMLSSLSAADRAKFATTYNTAIKNGWINQPSWVPTSAGSSGSASDGN